MEIVRSGRPIIWLCALALALSALTPKVGLRYCLGLDGHLDLAPVSSACCGCEELSDVSTRIDHCDPQGSDCCPCIDMSVAGSVDGIDRFGLKHNSVDLSFEPLFERDNLPLNRNVAFVIGAQESRGDELRWLRSVILRA